MKLRLVASIALVVAGFMFAAAPASAEVPGIKQTLAFKKMKGYVQFLYSKREKPVTNNKRRTYKTNLAGYRKNADAKVVALYNQRLNQIRRKDDVQERRQVKRIRVAQKRQVTSIKRRLNNRVGALKAKQSMAVTRIYNQYAPQINNLADKRDRLKVQLQMTTNPTKRAKLMRQIETVQTKINSLVSDRNTDANGVSARYSARITSVTSMFNSQITKVRASSRRQINQVRNAWRRTFRTQLSAANTRRDAQKEIVGAVASRGTGYIEQMPPAGN